MCGPGILLSCGQTPSGIDTLSYATATSYLTASLKDGFTYGAEAQGGTFSGFEKLTGGGAGDALSGDDQANVIRGSGGDYIDGGERAP